MGSTYRVGFPPFCYTEIIPANKLKLQIHLRYWGSQTPAPLHRRRNRHSRDIQFGIRRRALAPTPRALSAQRFQGPENLGSMLDHCRYYWRHCTHLVDVLEWCSSSYCPWYLLGYFHVSRSVFTLSYLLELPMELETNDLLALAILSQQSSSAPNTNVSEFTTASTATCAYLSG